ncbi:MAG: Hint domain-containing protein [Pseudomonadota bacterium]
MTIQLRQNADGLVANSAEPIAPIKVAGGIAPGTMIRTARGEVCAEDLKVGDRLVTREHGFATSKTIETIEHPACTIRTDSLGIARPERDTTVAADQHILLRDWRAEALFDAPAVYVPVKNMCDGKQITALGKARFLRLDLGEPLTIYANGLETPTGRTDVGVIELYETD